MERAPADAQLTPSGLLDKFRDYAALPKGHIEIDAHRAEQAKELGIETLQANTMDVRCPAEAFSLLYLNPPYDFEIGETNNQRLEVVFLEHTYRWLKPGGVLVFVIPQPQLRVCARILSEHFTDLSVYRLTDPASVQYKQAAVLGVRRKRHQHLRDSALIDSARWIEMLATKLDLEVLGDAPTVRYEVPSSEPVTLTNSGIPLDDVEDLLQIPAQSPKSMDGYRRSFMFKNLDLHDWS